MWLEMRGRGNVLTLYDVSISDVFTMHVKDQERRKYLRISFSIFLPCISKT